jgi:hypothetical protein
MTELLRTLLAKTQTKDNNQTNNNASLLTQELNLLIFAPIDVIVPKDTVTYIVSDFLCVVNSSSSSSSFFFFLWLRYDKLSKIWSKYKADVKDVLNSRVVTGEWRILPIQVSEYCYLIVIVMHCMDNIAVFVIRYL